MDLTNDELIETQKARGEYLIKVTKDEAELIEIYRKLTKVEQCIVIREMKARDYLNHD